MLLRHSTKIINCCIPAETEYAIGLVVETYDSRFGEFIESLGIDETNVMKKGI